MSLTRRLQTKKTTAPAILRGLYLALCSAAILCVMAPPVHAQSALTHHVRDAVSSGQAQLVSRLPATQSLRLHIMLPLRDQAGLDKFLSELYDPSSPSYRHFLTVAEFTERFGPGEDDYDSLIKFVESSGFKAVGGSRDGMDLQIEGSVAVIERAFKVNMGVYRHPTENRTFYAPDREPTVGLPFPLWHISGLDNYSIPQPAISSRTESAKGPGPDRRTVVQQATSGSGPSASFLGSDMRAAYYGGTSLTGTGQSLGLLEFYGTDMADLNTYFSNIGQSNNVPITLFSTDGTSTSCLSANKCDDLEQTIDMTQAIGMAPGLSSLVVYVGSTDTALISAMTTHNPLPTTISCSWIWGPADTSTLDPYFKKMAAQGQTFFVATGDHSTWTASNPAWPSDDANVVAVGGTSLVTAGPAGLWQSETAWLNSGGGISPDSIAIPSWQKTAISTANAGSTTLRNGPDVSANADYTFYACADQTACTANHWGGTSFAAPMWAAYTALINQQALANGNARVGFLNPTLYSLAEGSGYSSDFHDVTSGASGSYAAVSGFDLVTGWGSPNAGLLAAIAGISTSPDFTISSSTAPVSVPQNGKATSTITTAALGGFNSAIALSATGQPTGVTVTFSPASVAAPGSGTSTMTVATATTAAAGSYTITVSGTGGGITHKATVALTITAPAFTVTASPTSVSAAQGTRATTIITTSVSGGFSSAITLTASGLPTGTTASFSQTSTVAPGSGSSTLTLTVGSTTAAGTYLITVTGAGGGLTHTATVSLAVTAPVFAISASPASDSVAQGGKGTSTITTAVSGGFSSAITLSASGLPTGTTAAFSPASVAAPGSGSSTLTLTVGSTTAAGTYPVTVTGTGGGTTHTATVSLTVTAPAFTISASPTSISLAHGASGTSTVTTAVSGGFNSAIALSATGQPAGVTISFNPTSVAAPGSGNSTMTMAVASTVAAGSYPITVTGTGGGTTHTSTVTLTVTATTPAFAISAPPSTVSVARGSSGTTTITTTVSGGFDSAVALTASGLPLSTTASFTPASIAAPGSGTSTLTLKVGSLTLTGSYKVTVTGTSGGTSHTATVNLNVH